MNITNEDKCTALMYATGWDHLESVKVLLDAGADVNFTRPEWPWTALHYATSTANYRCVDALLSAGADVNKITQPESILAVTLDSSTHQCRVAFEQFKVDYIPENHSYSNCVKLLIQAGAHEHGTY